MNKKIFKGTIVFTPSKDDLQIHEDSYIIIEDGRVLDIVKELDSSYKDIEVQDYTGKLIIPGFSDLHLHAVQYPNKGLGMDRELLPWLETYTFPEEGKFSDLAYAEKVFKRFINELWSEGTLRSVVFSSIHKEGTELLMDMFIDSGLGAYVGKVNMDRNTADYLTEDTEDSIRITEELIVEYKDKSDLVKPIITPRFAPTCSDELLGGLGELAKKYNVPVQSHLNENKSEIEWVKELFPDSKNYASVYNDYKLYDGSKTVLAHCIHCNEDEIDLLREKGVYAAHCPYSNYNLSSGIMPIRKYLDKGVNVGLGSDISGGHEIRIPSVMWGSIQASKMTWLNTGKRLEPLSLSEAFFLGTKGGGSFFGKVGSFEKDYEFDALVIDDLDLSELKDVTVEERLQRYVYAGDASNIEARYVRGERIEKPFNI